MQTYCSTSTLMRLFGENTKTTGQHSKAIWRCIEAKLTGAVDTCIENINQIEQGQDTERS